MLKTAEYATASELQKDRATERYQMSRSSMFLPSEVLDMGLEQGLQI